MSLLNIFRNSSRRKDGRHKFLEMPPVIIQGKDHRISVDKINPNALKVVRTLQQQNHKAYLVGGCVRDLLIGRIPKDFDIVTDAHPYAIKRIFPFSRIIGRRFRIVHIPFGSLILETATFRALPENEETDDENLMLKRDNTYGTETEDAVRRDFTINALFFDPVNEEIIDHVGGYQDIKSGIIRIIGDANVSYQEDPVRMIRALKFQATTGFKLEKNTYNQILQHKNRILQCPTARIMEEIYKIMRSGCSLKAIMNLQKAGLLEFLMPALDLYLRGELKNDKDLLNHAFTERLVILDDLTNRKRNFDKPLFLVVLFYDLLEQTILQTGNKDRDKAANTCLQPLFEEMGFSRNDKDKAVKMITVQPRLINGASRNMRASEKLVHNDYFKPALDLFEILCRQSGSGSDDLLFWVNLYKKNIGTIMAEKKKTADIRKRSNRRRRSSRPRPII